MWFPHFRRIDTVVPDGYKDKVNDHINSVYVGTVLRIYDPRYSNEGQLATADWATEQGVYVTLHDEQRSFIVLHIKMCSIVYQLTLFSWTWIRKKKRFSPTMVPPKNGNFCESTAWSDFWFFLNSDRWLESFMVPWSKMSSIMCIYLHWICGPESEKNDFCPPWYHLKTIIFANT